MLSYVLEFSLEQAYLLVSVIQLFFETLDRQLALLYGVVVGGLEPFCLFHALLVEMLSVLHLVRSHFELLI
jgi:hypothetical protein